MITSNPGLIAVAVLSLAGAVALGLSSQAATSGRRSRTAFADVGTLLAVWMGAITMAVCGLWLVN